MIDSGFETGKVEALKIFYRLSMDHYRTVALQDLFQFEKSLSRDCQKHLKLWECFERFLITGRRNKPLVNTKNAAPSDLLLFIFLFSKQKLLSAN